MKLTPLDIKKQEFKKSLRGYDPLEVDAFLEMVADELEDLIRERNGLADEVLKLKTQLRDYQSVEQTLKETLMNAQKNINESRENSERQAEMIIREAELKAEKMLEETKLKLADMKNELLILKAQKDSFARRLRHLLESQLDLISVLQMDDLGYEKQERKKSSTGGGQKPQAGQIEFQSVEDELQEDDDPNPSEERPEEAPDLNWKKDAYGQNEKKASGDESIRRNKISDHLII